jgi:hypothetical protein
MDVRPQREKTFGYQPEPPLPKDPDDPARYADLPEPQRRQLDRWVAAHVARSSLETPLEAFRRAFVSEAFNVPSGAMLGAMYAAGYGSVAGAHPARFKATLLT